MENLRKKGIFNKHLLISLSIFITVIFIVTIFISFLKDTVKYDSFFNKYENGKKVIEK